MRTTNRSLLFTCLAVMQAFIIGCQANSDKIVEIDQQKGSRLDVDRCSSVHFLRHQVVFGTQTGRFRRVSYEALSDDDLVRAIGIQRKLVNRELKRRFRQFHSYFRSNEVNEYGRQVFVKATDSEKPSFTPVFMFSHNVGVVAFNVNDSKNIHRYQHRNYIGKAVVLRPTKQDSGVTLKAIHEFSRDQ